MSSNDSDTPINFSLVLTYIPALLLILRASVILVVYVCMHGIVKVPIAVLVTGVLLFSYLDWFVFRHDKLSKACGFLAPLALTLIANGDFYITQPCASSTLFNTLYYVNSIAWASTSSYVFFNQMLQLKYPTHDTTSAALWIVNCIFHVYVHCQTETFLVLTCRVILFYAMTITHWFAQVLISDCDRNRFAFTVLHTALHVLFVDIYAVGATALIFVGVILYSLHQTSAAKSTGPKTAPKSSPCMITTDVESQPENMNTLLNELRAAKQRAQSTPTS